MPQGLLVLPGMSPACSDAVVVVAVVAAAVVVVALVVVMVMCDWWCCFCASCNHLTTQLFFHAFRSQKSSNRLFFFLMFSEALGEIHRKYQCFWLWVVDVNAFQWSVRPRWGRMFGKSVRCCVQVVFIMFMFSPIDAFSWVFHGHRADGCSYPLVFWVFCFPYFCNIGHFISLNGIPWSLDS